MQMPKYLDLEYKRPSVDEIRECALRTRLRLMTSKDISLIDTALAEFQHSLSGFYTAEALCNIRFDQDTENEYFRLEQDFFEENEPIVSELSSMVYGVLLNMDDVDMLKERFGEMIFRKAQTQKETVNSSVLELLSLESSLENDYDQIMAQANINFRGKTLNLSMMEPYFESETREIRMHAQEAAAHFFESKLDLFNDIFSQLVETRTSIAVKLGFDDFVSLGYKRMERYDYTPEMVSSFREMVCKYIVPLTSEIRRLQKDRLSVSELKYFDLPVLFPKGNPKPIINMDEYPAKTGEMFSALMGKTPSFFDILREYGFMDLVSRANKATGGYCVTLLDYAIPFILMNANGTAEDVTTLIHESGHAYASLRSADASPFIECLSPTLETCEIHSTALEYLTYPYLELFFGDRAADVRDLHMTRSLLFIPYGCMVDEFQHEIYAASEMGNDERHQVWKRLEEKYQPFLDYDGQSFYESGAAWVKKGHIFTDPFYYIDYCLAQVVSLQLWDKSRSSPAEAMRVYDSLCKEGGNSVFLDLLSKSGLESPFESGVIKRIAYRAAEFLQL